MSLTIDLSGRPLGVQEAYDALGDYASTYGELPLRLLLHAAVPQSFRPDLLNLLKVNFVPEAGGDLSVDADVLLSPLVEVTTAGYFRLDSEVRRQSLDLLDAVYRSDGSRRSVRVARFLIAWLDQLEQASAAGMDPLLAEYVVIQRWVALALIDPSAVAAALAMSLQDALAEDKSAVRARLGGIAAALSIPLSGHQPLLSYAQGIDALRTGNIDEARRLLEPLGDSDIRIGDVTLRPAADVLDAYLLREPKKPSFGLRSEEESPGQRLISEPEIDDYLRRRAYEIFKEKKQQEFRLFRLPGEELRHFYESDVYESKNEALENWKSAAIYFASDILRGEGRLWKEIDSDITHENNRWKFFTRSTFSVLQETWLSDVIRFHAYVHWVRRGAEPFSDTKVDYTEACQDFLSRVRNASIKFEGKEAYDGILDYLVGNYLLSPEYQVDPERPGVRKLVEIKAERFYQMRGSGDEAANWFRAEAYVRRFYNNIVSAILLDDANGKSEVRKAFASSEDPKFGGSIADCFEAMLLVYYIKDFDLPAVWTQRFDSPAVGPPPMTGAPPKVFISYSHDTVGHQDRVLDLADRLRADGIDAEVDQYNAAPPEGWPLWCKRQIEAADFVLMVCTEAYHRRVRGDEERGQGLGAVWEATIIRQLLYDAGAVSDKFVPVLFSDASPEQIPTLIRGLTHYFVDTTDGYEELYRRVTGQPKLVRPALGMMRALPAKRRQWLDPPWCPEMVALPAGEYRMGSPEVEQGRYGDEGPQHWVTIGTRLAIGRYPVTFAEYDHFCAAAKREQPEDQGWGRGRRPVINVSWLDAVAYCEWLAKETGQPYRLPSEAEWEYACRAGTTTRYSFGDQISEKDANYGGKIGKTTEVGSYPPNDWGLYDMHGNIWEWCADHWHDTYAGAPTDGSAWIDAGAEPRASRVRRGGSWQDGAQVVCSTSRRRRGPDRRLGNVGFRCARVQES